MTRNEIVEQSKTIVSQNKSTILSFCTGLGKTFTSLQCMKHVGGKWLIVLSETSHIKNWYDDIVKHGLEDLLMNLEFVLYASLHKHEGLSYDGITADECHHLSEQRSDTLSNINHRKFIGLSATLEDDVKDRIRLAIGNFYEYKITLAQAIKWKLLPKPKIHLIKLHLDAIHPTEELTITKGIAKNRIRIICSFSDRWKHLKANEHVELIVSCTQQQKYDHLCEQVEFWKNRYFRTQLKAFENKWLLMATTRKRFLAEAKTSHVSKLLKTIKGRYICFAGSIPQCDQLGSKNVVHSKRKDNQLIIDKFNDYKVDNLFAVGMLREGVNLKEANVVIVQLDSGTRSTLQMVGRGLRYENPEIYIFYYENTQDQKYLENSLEEFKEIL